MSVGELSRGYQGEMSPQDSGDCSHGAGVTKNKQTQQQFEGHLMDREGQGQSRKSHWKYHSSEILNQINTWCILWRPQSS